MSVREYIGARYVPLFADPIQWDNTNSYEPLTVVMNLGTSYVSRQWVPAGIAIDNEDYWIAWADYNAQIEQYRQEVQAFDGRIDTLEGKFDANGDVAENLVNTASIEDDAVTNDKIADNAVDTAQIVDDAVTNDKIADDAVDTAQLVDDAVTADKIANNAVDTAQLVDGAVTFEKLAPLSVTKEKIGTNTYAKLKSDFIGSTVIWIADSWGRTDVYNVTKNHIDIVSEELKFGTLYKRAIGSRGYCRYDAERPSYLQTLQEIDNDATINNDTINYIIVEGSINDDQFTQDQIVSAMTTFWAYAKENFPNAQGIVIPTFGNNTHATGWELTAFANRVGARDAGVPYIRGGHWLLYNFADYWNADNVHPNQQGQNYIAKALIEGLCCGTMKVIQSPYKRTTVANISTVTANTNAVIGQSIVNLIGNTFYFIGTIEFRNGDAQGAITTVNTEVWRFDIANTSSDWLLPMYNHGPSANDELIGACGARYRNSAVEICNVLMGFTDDVNKVKVYLASNMTQYGSVKCCIPIAQTYIGVDD